MKRTLKWIIGSLIGAGLGLAIVEESDGQMAFLGEGGDGLPRPRTSASVRDGSDELSEWFAFHWAAEGYKMPEWNEIFTWDKYLVKVTDGIPHKFDAVYYLEGGEVPGCGMVCDAPGNKDEPVIVENPLLNPAAAGFVLIHAVERSRVLGYLRPKSKE